MSEILQQPINQMTKDTAALFANQFQSYRVRLQDCLNNITIMDAEEKSILTQIKNLQNQIDEAEFASERELAKILLKESNIAAKEGMQNQYQILFERLKIEYQKAYQLINEIRALFFAPITYSFAFEIDGEVFEVNTTEENLFPLMYIEMESRAKQFDKIYKLRLSNNKQLLISWKEEMIKRHGESFFQPISKNYDTVWSALVDFQIQNNASSSSKKISDGQRYEAYRNILAENNINNHQYSELKASVPDITQYLIAKFNEIRKNNLSWTRGGDVGDEQDKYMSASITSATTLITTIRYLLTNVFTASSTQNTKELATNIAKVFGGSNYLKKTLSKAEQFALEQLSEEIYNKLKLAKN